MPKIVCPICKKGFSVGGIPEETLSHMISDTLVEELVERIMEISRDESLDEEQKTTGVDFAIVTKGKNIYMCPFCEVMIISGDGEPAGVYRKVKN